MRGALGQERGDFSDSRIIPADAGSTSSSAKPTIPNGDHPRGCGEHPQQRQEREPHPGSSPRMRGAQLAWPQMAIPLGIIPADAGSTYLRSRSSSACRDHPRGCGEHVGGALLVVGLRGSSPRMRGAQDSEAQEQKAYRIIPADAGSTVFPQQTR